MLLNEFLKEHRKNEAQEATISAAAERLRGCSRTTAKAD
jgi:hypothetical protein